MNQELAQRWELDNLLAVSLVIAQSALERRESRGAHTREDYPERQDAFNYHTLAQISPEGNVVFSQRPINMDIFESGADYADKFGYISRKY
jgi:succinate dehydrogenase / fumarate reductase flavoprotein subunit